MTAVLIMSATQHLPPQTSINHPMQRDGRRLPVNSSMSFYNGVFPRVIIYSYPYMRDIGVT